MKKNNISRCVMALIALAIGCATAMAQYNTSSYFMEGMYYRHNLNPAFAAERSYINLPFFMIGNMNVGMQSNVGVDNFLYPCDRNGYKLTTFMDPSIDANQFLSGLNDNNVITTNISLPILAFGFHSWGGFNTVELGVKTRVNANLPYDLFALAKSGMSSSNTVYNIDDLRVKAMAYGELAFGHSRKFLDNKLAVGIKLKALIGGGNIDGHIKNLNLTMSDSRWSVKGDGEINGSVKGAYFKHDSDGDINGFDIDGPGIGGFGGAIDLGAEYDFKDLVPGLKVSAAILDLGFINWSESLRATVKEQYTFDGFKQPIVIDAEPNDPGDIDNQIDQIGDDLEALFKLKEDKNAGSRSTSLGATLNVGAEYALPIYKKLRFGLLSSTYFDGPFTSTEARLSANVAPLSWFDASVSYGMGTYGSSMGWILNFHPKGLNLFVGANHTSGKITPQGIPVGKANFQFNMGINITWGCKKI